MAHDALCRYLISSEWIFHHEKNSLGFGFYAYGGYDLGESLWPVHSALLQGVDLLVQGDFCTCVHMVCKCLTESKKGRTLMPSGLNFSTGAYRGLMEGYEAMRHGWVQGIPKLNIANGNKTLLGLKESSGKNEAAEDLTHMRACCVTSACPRPSHASVKHYLRSDNRDVR